MPDETFVATIDSYLDWINNTTNYGTSLVVDCGVAYAGEEKQLMFRAIGNFNVSSIAAMTIVSAKLRQYVVTASGTNGGWVGRCTRPADWVEDEVSWDKYSTAGGNWTAGGGDIDKGTPGEVAFTLPGTDGWWEITGMEGYVTDAIANRANKVSVIMYLDEEDPGSAQRVQWRSKDYTDFLVLRWNLVVTYAYPVSGNVSQGHVIG